MFNYLKKHNMRNSLKTLLCLTVICVFSNNAAARICFLPDGNCGKTKINVNSGKNGCIYKSETEANTGKNDECEVSYQSGICWWRRCNTQKADIFDKLADCQKKIEDATSQKCQACGSCYKLVPIQIPQNACPDGYSTKYQSQNDCPDGKTFSENGTYNGLVCGACIPAKTCPSGYSTQYQSQKDCPTGETFSSSGSVGNLICGKCVSATCTDVAANENKLEEIHQYETISATKTENVVDANSVCGTEKVNYRVGGMASVSGYNDKYWFDDFGYSPDQIYSKHNGIWYHLYGGMCRKNLLCSSLVEDGYIDHYWNKNSKDYCCKQNILSTNKEYTSSEVDSIFANSCKPVPTTTVIVASEDFSPYYVCDKGTIGSDGKCHLGTYSYSCPSGYTLNGEKCVSQTMSCPTGYTASAKDATSYYCRKTEYTCPTTFSYTLSGSKCLCKDTEDIISITALSCSDIYETPSYRDIQTSYSFIYSPNQQQSLNAYVFTKDLISGETDDNDIGIHTAGDIDEYIDNLTYSSGCPNGAIDTFSRYYKEDYEDNGESYKAGEYSRRENIADVKFFIGEDSSNLINTQQKVPFPFYDIDNTPTKSAEFTYNNQKYVITAVKKEISYVDTCDDGYSSEKPSDNIFYYTQKGNCYKATGCIENGIVSAKRAVSVKNSLRWKNSDSKEVTHTGQTCYINWPTNIEFYIMSEIGSSFSSNEYPIWPTSESGIFWKRSNNDYRVRVSEIKDKFYLKSVNMLGKKFTYGIYFKGYYCRGNSSITCASQNQPIVFSDPDGYVYNFGDHILPGVDRQNPLKYSGASYVQGTSSSYWTHSGGFVNGDETNTSGRSIIIIDSGNKDGNIYSTPNDTMTVCYILKGYLDDAYTSTSDLKEICKDIDIIPYVKATPEYDVTW